MTKRKEVTSTKKHNESSLEKSPIKSEKKHSKNLSAATPDSLENKCIAMAMDLAAQRLADGTATSQLIVEFIKRGSKKERMEQEIMAEQKKLLVAKTEMLQSQKQIESLYADAITAMKKYRGETEVDDPILQ